MNLDFTFYIPTRIIFGCGKLNELRTMPYLPGKRALVVIGSSGAMKRQGDLDNLLKADDHCLGRTSWRCRHVSD